MGTEREESSVLSSKGFFLVLVSLFRVRNFTIALHGGNFANVDPL